MPFALQERTLETAQGGDQGKPGNRCKCPEELFDPKGVGFPRRLGVIDGESHWSGRQGGEHRGLKIWGDFKTEKRGDFGDQRFARLDGVAPDEKPPGAEAGGNLLIVQRRERDGALPNAGRAQDGHGLRRVCEKRRHKITNFAVPTKAAGRRRKQRGFTRRGVLSARDNGMRRA